LEASSHAAMGDAFRALEENLNINTGWMQRASGSYAPTIFLISGSSPSDDYKTHLFRLWDNVWFKRATKIALSVGNDAVPYVLEQFTGAKETVVNVAERDVASNLAKMIKFINHDDDEWYERENSYMQYSEAASEHGKEMFVSFLPYLCYDTHGQYSPYEYEHHHMPKKELFPFWKSDVNKYAVGISGDSIYFLQIETDPPVKSALPLNWRVLFSVDGSKCYVQSVTFYEEHGRCALEIVNKETHRHEVMDVNLNTEKYNVHECADKASIYEQIQPVVENVDDDSWDW
jgi:hypothetical protein